MAEQMIDIEYLKQLLELFDGSTVNDLRIEHEGVEIRLSKSARREEPTTVQYVPAPALPSAAASAPTAAPPTTPEPPAATETPTPNVAPTAPVSASAGCAVCPAGYTRLVPILAPMPGTVYLAPSPGAPPFVQPGQMVAAGDTLCIIEAMKLMNEIESEVSGRVVEILAENAKPVEFGQVLFRIDPKG